MPLEEREQPKTDWDRYSEFAEDDDDVLTSEFDHKAFLLKQKIKKNIENPEDLLINQLQLSFIDRNLAYIYSLKVTAAEEWRNLGLPTLAKRRIAHLMSKLALLKSVDGFERILQTSATSAQLDVTSQQQAMQQLPDEREEQRRPTIIQKLLKR